jgi:hypothetical protein
VGVACYIAEDVVSGVDTGQAGGCSGIVWGCCRDGSSWTYTNCRGLGLHGRLVLDVLWQVRCVIVAHTAICSALHSTMHAE